MGIKLNEPIGNSLYGPLIVRCALGAFFILAGHMKLQNPQAFVQEVQSLNLMPHQLATVYGILIPYFEIGTGALLIAGFWTTLGAIFSSLLLVSFVWVSGGLFPHSKNLFNKEILILAASLSLLYSGAGAFSIDRFRKNG